ncbi:MAG: glycosyltransferase family 4 protein [Ruminococcus flavefaciens]|nr:glycosyltransferase family 4 protein [Eubacterium sp.]MCM1236786.1 glycosyltransferase family 4 protein [Ruminococcus flavefaciens]
MKVLYMSHRYHTNQTTIMKGWVENGHEVRFLSQYAGRVEDYTYVKPIVVGYSKLFIAFDYIYVHFLKKNDPFAIDMKLKCGIPPLRKLAKYIKEFQPDIAIIRERSVYTICMNAICRYYHIPTILYNLSPVWDKPKKMDLAHKIVWRLTPRYRITPTNLVGIDFTGLVKDKYGYWAPFLMEPQMPPWEKTYFADGRINVFCIGKYQERKNLQMMIEVVEKLLPEYDLHLTIAGEVSNHFHEEYYQRVTGYVQEHGLEEKVTFYRNLNRKEIAKQYRKADVYVIPSTGEPASITVIEAMAFSVPAISGSDNGTASYIDYGRTGYVFEDNDQKDLQDKLEKIICDRENLVKMGAAGYDHVKRHFQFQNYYDCIEEIRKKMDGNKQSQ